MIAWQACRPFQKLPGNFLIKLFIRLNLKKSMAGA